MSKEIISEIGSVIPQIMIIIETTENVCYKNYATSCLSSILWRDAY